MSIGIYTDANPATLISKSATFTNPLLVALDGRLGGITQKKLYLRNDDNTLWYSTNTVTPADLIDPTIVNGTNGISWKLRAGGTQPTDEEWAAITAGNTISLANLGSGAGSDTSTYLPFWVRVQIPRNTSAKTILDVTLTINTNENVV